MSEIKGWVLVVGILAIVGWGMYTIVQAVEEGSRAALAPMEKLSTQVAQVLEPTPTIRPDPVTIVRQVRTLARLETVQYSVEKIITAEVNQEGLFGPLFGDRLLFVAHGVVIAGLDLSRVREEDISVVDGTLYLRLPEPEIFLVALDNQKSYVYDREKGLLTKGNVHLETEARKAAENALREAALEDGILEQARQNGETFLRAFLMTLGFSQVEFPSRPPTSRPTP